MYYSGIYYLVRVKEDCMKKNAMLMTQRIINQRLYQSRVKYATATKSIVFFYRVVTPRLVQAVGQDYSILAGHVVSVTEQWAPFIQYTNDVTL